MTPSEPVREAATREAMKMRAQAQFGHRASTSGLSQHALCDVCSLPLNRWSEPCTAPTSTAGLLAQDVLALLADRDRLAGENAEQKKALAAYEAAVQGALRAAPLHWQEYRDPFELRSEIVKARRIGRAALTDSKEAE